MTATDADLVVPVWQDCGLGNGGLNRLFNVDDQVQYLVTATVCDARDIGNWCLWKLELLLSTADFTFCRCVYEVCLLPASRASGAAKGLAKPLCRSHRVDGYTM